MQRNQNIEISSLKRKRQEDLQGIQTLPWELIPSIIRFLPLEDLPSARLASHLFHDAILPYAMLSTAESRIKFMEKSARSLQPEVLAPVFMKRHHPITIKIGDQSLTSSLPYSFLALAAHYRHHEVFDSLIDLNTMDKKAKELAIKHACRQCFEAADIQALSTFCEKNLLKQEYLKVFGGKDLSANEISRWESILPELVRLNDAPLLKRLLRICSRDLRSLLHTAIQYGHVACIEVLLKMRPSELNNSTNMEKTFLERAIENGNPTIIKLLIEKGATVNKEALKQAFEQLYLNAHELEANKTKVVFELVKAFLDIKQNDINEVESKYQQKQLFDQIMREVMMEQGDYTALTCLTFALTNNYFNIAHDLTWALLDHCRNSDNFVPLVKQLKSVIESGKVKTVYKLLSTLLVSGDNLCDSEKSQLNGVREFAIQYVKRQAVSQQQRGGLPLNHSVFFRQQPTTFEESELAKEAFPFP